MMFKCKICGAERDLKKSMRLHIKAKHKKEIRELCKQNRELKAELDKNHSTRQKDKVPFNSLGSLIEVKI